MAVMKNKDGTELMVDCDCGCDNGMRFKIDRDDYDWHCFVSYTSGNWYRDQCENFLDVIRKKWRKIWAIIRNKDHHYSDIYLTKEEFETFKEYINGL